MMSRFPSRLFLIGAAGLAVLLLIPADRSKPSLTGLAIGDAAPAATTAPIETAATPVLLANEPPVLTTPAAAPNATAVASPAPADTALVEPKSAWVRASAVNVRAGPSTATARLFALQRGAKVAITESAGDWAFVTDQGGESGWVHSNLLADSPAAAIAAPREEPVREVKQKFGRISNAVLLRAGPSRFAPRLFVLRAGERIAVVETRGRWVRVVLESGASAWVDARDLSR